MSQLKNVKHPSHYTLHPSGIECIHVIEHMNYNIGAAIKYLWRQGLKKEAGKDELEKQIEDLEKAKQMIDFEILRLSR